MLHAFSVPIHYIIYCMISRKLLDAFVLKFFFSPETFRDVLLILSAQAYPTTIRFNVLLFYCFLKQLSISQKKKNLCTIVSRNWTDLPTSERLLFGYSTSYSPYTTTTLLLISKVLTLAYLFQNNPQSYINEKSFYFYRL